MINAYGNSIKEFRITNGRICTIHKRKSNTILAWKILATGYYEFHYFKLLHEAFVYLKTII